MGGGDAGKKKAGLETHSPFLFFVLAHSEKKRLEKLPSENVFIREFCSLIRDMVFDPAGKGFWEISLKMPRNMFQVDCSESCVHAQTVEKYLIKNSRYWQQRKKCGVCPRPGKARIKGHGAICAGHCGAQA